ncbi:MAG TPA: alpha/beta hydrolase, partial [Herpetosiphonaceae bacterium]|nr:alpha/beta hydrolase [Herpetosiphonaceae bacterium]
QKLAYTPPILGADGTPAPGSIATLEQVRLGGSEQWITVRGKDIHNPVLLYLPGGPGGSELPKTRVHLQGLEDHFVVVNWDQPGTGKSYDALPIASITPERYIADGHELVLKLRQRFNQEKIYVFGDSWGSVVGIQLVQRYPELFHAYAGTGQMVAFTENDRMCYELALSLARERRDTAKIEQLTRQGPPPYYGKGMVWKMSAVLMYLNDLMPGRGGDLLMDTLRAPEYGVYDKVNAFRGPVYTLDAVYPHLWEVDFRTQARELAVPVYIFHGRKEANAMPALVEEYYRVLDAPHKELIWLEDSGHDALYMEPAKIEDLLVNRVLAQTDPRR